MPQLHDPEEPVHERKGQDDQEADLQTARRHPHYDGDAAERIVPQPAYVQEDDKNVEDETQMLLASGKSSCARIIPKAILYHTGELMDENDEGEEEDELPQSA